MTARASAPITSGGCLHGASYEAGIGGRSGGMATLTLEHPEIANVISAKLEARSAARIGRRRAGLGLGNRRGKSCLIIGDLLFEGIVFGVGGQLARHGIVERLGAYGGLTKLLGRHSSGYAGLARGPSVMPAPQVQAADDGQHGTCGEGPAREGREQERYHSGTSSSGGRGNGSKGSKGRGLGSVI